MRDLWGCAITSRPDDVDGAWRTARGCLASWLDDVTGGEADLGGDGQVGGRTTQAGWRVDDGIVEARVTGPAGIPASQQHTRLLLRRERNKLRVVCRAAVHSPRFPQQPPGPLDPPAIVPALLRDVAFHDANTRLLADAVTVDGASVDAFAELLCHPTRRLPVVVLSTARSGQTPLPPSAAAYFAGQAHVRVLADDAAWQLSAAVGRRRSVFGGAARIYWPGFTVECRPADHRYWTAETLAADPDGVLAQLRARVTDLLLLRVPDTSPLEQRRERAQRASDQRVALLEPGDASESWLLWAERLLDERDELEAELAAAQAELERIRPADDDAGRFATVADAAAAATFGPYVELLPEAYASAAASPYRNPARVYDALTVLNEAAERYAAGSLPGGFRAFFASRGLSYASNVAPTTVGRWPGDYRRSYDGRDITLGPHLQLGTGPPESCCRIYWWVDTDRRRLVVGHVGKHLRNSLTNG